MKYAVIVIDVQQGLFVSEAPAFVESTIKNINLVTDKARKLDVPVIFIHHTRSDCGLASGSDAWQIVKEVSVHLDDLHIEKSTPDSFLNTSLQDELVARGVTDLAICGYATEFCVDTTVRRAAALKYNVTLIADAHTTHDKPHASAEWVRSHHNATLPEVTSFEGDITLSDAEDIFI